MTTDPTKPTGGAAVAAHIISDLFSPLLIPSYAMAAALWLTMLRYLPLGVKLWALGGIFALTCVGPALVIFTLMHMGKVSDASVSNRRQRPIPYCVAIMCYAGAAWFTASMQAPAWLSAFYISAAITSLLSLAITCRWKISAHTGAMAGLAAALFWMACHGLISSPMLWITLSTAVLGAVAWSRLYLNHHTPLQTLAGALLSAATVYIALTISLTIA